jgi:heme-degrading monooxygenase HmoA
MVVHLRPIGPEPTSELASEPEVSGFAATPEPPYTAVIFTSRRTNADVAGYEAMAISMDSLAARQPGYLGIESVRREGELAITVSYWVDDESARAWKQVAEHQVAQQLGRDRWYTGYRLRVARVERDYGFDST